MSDNWNFYFCKVNDVLASIFVDLGLHELAPDESRPYLLWVWVHLKTPRSDGLSDSVEFDSLVAIEEKITEGLSQKFDAILCGRITTDGRREFYYYAARSEAFEPTVENVMGRFRGYEFDCGCQAEPDWKQYLTLLYPSEENRQCIENRSVLEVLERKGDTLNTPRDVLHWIYFPTVLDRDAFWTAVQPLEYRIQSRPDKPGGELPFGLCIVRFQSVKQSDIDEAVLELFRHAKEFRGDYDGWETEVISR
jgi:Family of unknown function (DUF695)/Regulator of ribonuclease activity B